MAWLRERWRIFLGAALGVALIGVLGGAVMRYFIEPIALLLWAGWNVIASVHQSVYWGALIVGAIILIIRLVPWTQETRQAPSYAHKPASPERIERWQKLIRGARNGARGEEELRVALQQLLTPVTASGRPASEDLEASLASAHRRLPEEARGFLFPTRGTRRPLAALWQRLTGGGQANLDAVIKWMEGELEIRDDQ